MCTGLGDELDAYELQVEDSEIKITADLPRNKNKVGFSEVRSKSAGINVAGKKMDKMSGVNRVIGSGSEAAGE